MGYHTADLCDAYGKDLQVAEDRFQSFGKKKSFYGPMYTVKVVEDNSLVLKALETIPEGTVLIVDGNGSTACALLGDRLAGIARDRKLGGVIINGCVRDTAELAQMDVGILAVGKSPRRSKKEGKGDQQISLHFAGVTWEPGKYVYVDEDGIVLSENALTL